MSISLKCPECGLEASSSIALAGHWRAKHKNNQEQLYMASKGLSERPKCACSCGEELKFHNVDFGYGTYKRGHISRVKNSWGHNEAAQKKSQEKRRKMWKSGEIVPWNKGLTVDTDERVKAYGETQRSNETEESKKRKSLMMKQQWETENIKPLCGPDHPNWNGGTSTLSTYCHWNERMYAGWKRPKLVAAGFKCTRCSSSKDLHVHHCGERMAAIVKRFAEKHGYEGRDDQRHLMETIAGEVAEYHITSDVPGEVICAMCHGKEHPSLNFEYDDVVV